MEGNESGSVGKDAPAPAGGADGARGVGAVGGGDAARSGEAKRSRLYPS